MKSKTGKKDDNGKPKIVKGLLQQFPRACKMIPLLSEYGANKYKEVDKWDNWENTSNGEQRYKDALGRHLTEEGISELDEESGYLHLAHAAWCAIAALELKLRGKE